MIGSLCKDFVTLTTSLLELLWSEIGLYLSINSEEVLVNTVFQVTDQQKTVFSSLHRPIFCFVGLRNQGCQIYYKSRGKNKKSGWPKLGFKNQKKNNRTWFCIQKRKKMMRMLGFSGTRSLLQLMAIDMNSKSFFYHNLLLKSKGQDLS